MCGAFEIQRKVREKKAYHVEASSYDQFTIARLGGCETEEAEE